MGHLQFPYCDRALQPAPAPKSHRSCLVVLDTTKRDCYREAMRTTKTLSITLPPEMLARAVEMAKREHRTMSELVREALREYERRSWWTEMNAFGQAKAAERGLTEADVEPAVREVRRARAARSIEPDA